MQTYNGVIPKMISGSKVKPSEVPFPSLGRNGLFVLLDLSLPGIVSSRMKHTIKRYLKRSGFRDLSVEHIPGDTPFTVRLIAVGRPVHAISEKGLERLRHLKESLLKVLNSVDHPSKADSEKLRLLLAKLEPSMKRAYYSQKPKSKLNRSLLT